MSEHDSQEQQPPITTAAMRLHELLVCINNANGSNLNDVLVNCLIVSSDPRPAGPWQSIKAQRLIAEMIDAVHRELDQFPPSERAWYGRCLDGVTKALAPANLHRQLSVAKSEIKDVDLVGLEHVHMIVRKTLLESRVEQVEFVPLVEAVEQALSAVNDSELPADLKDFIVSQLLRIKNAIDQYKFRGMRGVEEAVGGYLVSLAMSQKTVEEKLSAPEKSNLRKVIDTANGIIGLAHGAAWVLPPLLHAGSDLIKVLGS